MLTNIKASRMCLKYKETTEKTRKAKMTSSHITNTTTSTLHHDKEETKGINIIILCYKKSIGKQTATNPTKNTPNCKYFVTILRANAKSIVRMQLHKTVINCSKQRHFKPSIHHYPAPNATVTNKIFVKTSYN